MIPFWNAGVKKPIRVCSWAYAGWEPYSVCGCGYRVLPRCTGQPFKPDPQDAVLRLGQTLSCF